MEGLGVFFERLGDFQGHFRGQNFNLGIIRVFSGSSGNPVNAEEKRDLHEVREKMCYMN